MDPSFSPLSWDRRFFSNILHCKNMGQEEEKVSSRWISAHSCTSRWLCRVLPGIYFSFHSHRHSRRYILSVSFFRDEESQAKQWSGVPLAMRLRSDQGVGTGLLTRAISFMAAFPVSWKESKPGRINSNNKSKIKDWLFNICHALGTILITSGALSLSTFHSFRGPPSIPTERRNWVQIA